MSATYDATLPLTRDHVRLLIGDTNTSSPLLHDEEIEALIAAERASGTATKFYVAATCLDLIQARLAAQSGDSAGLTSKSVEGLSLSWGVPGSTLQVLVDRASSLRVQGAIAAATSPSQFRVL